LDVTNEFTTTEFWEQVNKETNLYASECLAQVEVNPSKHKSYDEQQWFPVTVDEMKAEFALCILMSPKKIERERYSKTTGVKQK
jgi:hypothetical protein